LSHRVPQRTRTKRTRLAATAAVASLGLALGATPALAADASGGYSASAAKATATKSSAKAKAKGRSHAASDLSRDTIRAAQRALGVKADGALGPRTRTAIRAYQRKQDLAVSGRLDSATLEALGVEARTVASEGTAAPTSTSGAAPTDAGPAPTGQVASQLEQIAQCESGGDPTAVSPSGQYRGKYQFSRETWESVGGSGDPAAAPEAEQDARAAKLMQTQGPGAWPVCSQQAS
jgi:hypothetical protein